MRNFGKTPEPEDAYAGSTVMFWGEGVRQTLADVCIGVGLTVLKRAIIA